MVESSVAFGIDLTPGVAQLRQQLSTIVQISKNTTLQIQQTEERHQQRMKQLKERQKVVDENVNVSSVGAHKKAVKAIELEEDRHDTRLKQMAERSALSQLALQERTAQIKHNIEVSAAKLIYRDIEKIDRDHTKAIEREIKKREAEAKEAEVKHSKQFGGVGINLSSAGHIAQSAGFYRTGHLLRAASNMGVGSEMAAGAGMAEMAAVALPVAGALAAIYVASKLVEVGFQAVEKTAMEFVGAITQIGGARGLQGMLVESSNAERQAANIAVNAGDQVSKAEVLQVMRSISNKSEFDKKDVGEMARSFIAKRGSFSEFKQLGAFGADLASVSGLSPSQSGAAIGQLRTQFPELTMADTKQAIMKLWGMGKEGAVELKDSTRMTQSLGFARSVSPNILAGLGLEMGMVQLAQRFTGGQSADQSVTGIRRLQEQLLSDPTSKKGQALQHLLGSDYLSHDETGRAVLTNAPNTMARIALGTFENRPGMSEAFESRSMKAIRGFVSGDMANQFVGKTEKEKVGILEEMFKKMEDSSSHLEQFNGALEVVKDTVDYKLKQAFNQLANELEEELMKVWPDIAKAVTGFTRYLIAHKEDFGTAVKDFVTGMIMIVKALPILGEAVVWLAKVLAQIVLSIGGMAEKYFGQKMPPSMRKSLEAINNTDPTKLKKDSQAMMVSIMAEMEKGKDKLNEKEKDKTYQALHDSHKEAMVKVDETNDLLKRIADKHEGKSTPPHPPVSSPDGFHR